MKYIFLSEFFESSALALSLKILEEQDVKVFLTDKGYHKILEGIIEKDKDFIQYMGQGNIFVTDDADMGEIAESLRAKKELVFGGSVQSDKWENERQTGQDIMKKAGIFTVPSSNFKGHGAFDKAIEFIKQKKGRWVVKQNGNEDKSLSTVGKFEDGTDVIDKLEDMKHSWTENIDFDLQEFIDGYEIAIHGWFNGKDWIRDTKGREVFISNWEHKKRSNKDLGRTTGETGTLAKRTSPNASINKELLKLTKYLQGIKYIGNVDINMMLSKKDMKFYGLEFTMRFGYPQVNYFQEMLQSPFSELIEGCVSGKNNFLKVSDKWINVTVVQTPPFPFESTKDSNNSRGQRIYFTDKGKWTGKDELTDEKLRHIHLYEVKFEKETKHFIATGDTGYLLTVTGQGDNPQSVNKTVIDYIKNNIYTSNMDYRTDIGIVDRVTESIGLMQSKGML